MPTYTYKCPNCKEEFEMTKEMQSSHTEEKCECGSIAIKQIGVPTIKCMGTGWTKNTFARNVIDDYKKKNSKVNDSYL